MRRRIAVALLPVIAFGLITPLTVSCQRAPSDPDAGMEELRQLARNASEKPGVSDLTRIEARYPRSRAAALARFLRGYLYYTSQNHKAAIEALDNRAISSASALGDYALFYRAESEVATDAKGEARRDYSSIY